MTKSELIRYLESYAKADDICYTCSQEVDQIKKRIQYLQGPPPKTVQNNRTAKTVTNILWVILIFPLLFLASWLFCEVLEYGLKMLLFGAVLSILLAYILASMVSDALFKRSRVKKAHQLSKEHEEARSSLPALQKQLQDKLAILRLYQENLNRLEKQKVLPTGYRSSYYARRFLKYINSGRADTLKEAINLYEMEKQQDALYEETRRHHNEMERQQARQTELAAATRAEASRAADAAEDAARGANDAAFWGAASAWELDDIRRKMDK